MRQSLFVKVLLTAVFMMPLFAAWGLAAPMHQACTGVLTQDGDYYELKPDAGSGPWCDASIDKKLAQRVLKVCAFGSRCHIVGSFIGHGTFYWTHISSAAATKMIKQAKKRGRPHEPADPARDRPRADARGIS